MAKKLKQQFGVTRASKKSTRKANNKALAAAINATNKRNAAKGKPQTRKDAAGHKSTQAHVKLQKTEAVRLNKRTIRSSGGTLQAGQQISTRHPTGGPTIGGPAIHKAPQKKKVKLRGPTPKRPKGLGSNKERNS